MTLPQQTEHAVVRPLNWVCMHIAAHELGFALEKHMFPHVFAAVEAAIWFGPSAVLSAASLHAPIVPPELVLLPALLDVVAPVALLVDPVAEALLEPFDAEVDVDALPVAAAEVDAVPLPPVPVPPDPPQELVIAIVATVARGTTTRIARMWSMAGLSARGVGMHAAVPLAPTETLPTPRCQSWLSR